MSSKRWSKERRLRAGFVLIGVGIAFFLMERYADLGHGLIFFLIGGGFLAAYLIQKNYGYLVPAGIMLGMGTGYLNLGSFSDGNDQQFLFGMGLGFIGIWAIGLAVERVNRWWPLIPGGVLIFLGLPRTDHWVDQLFDNWPLVLVAIGVVLVIVALTGKPSSEDSS